MAVIPGGAGERRARWWWPVLVVALPRLLTFPFNENLHGDAIAREWIARQWLSDPHVIGGFDQGAFQFGPLHIYLLAVAEWLLPTSLHAGRLVSLVVGSLTAWPLYALARREVSEASARWSVVLLAGWGLHVQSSTTAASEALNLLLIVAAAERLSAFLHRRSDRAALLGSALWLNLACATRYDSWLTVVLFSVVVGWQTRKWWTMVWFGAAASAFAVAWLFGNFVDRGDPLFPFRYIDDFHRAWYPSEEAAWGVPNYQVLSLLFWPATAALTLTPMVTLAGLGGLWRAVTTGRGRWLVLVVVLPAALYTFRSVALRSFCPLARFTMKELVLALPLVWLGVEPWLEGAWMRRAVQASAAALFLWLVGLGVYCYRNDAPLARALGPVAATSSVDGKLRRAGEAVEAALRPGEVAVVDVDPRGYDDLVVSSVAARSERAGAHARRRSPRYAQQLGRGPVGAVVRFVGGRLERDGELEVHPGGRATFRGVELSVVAAEPPLEVYRPLTPGTAR